MNVRFSAYLLPEKGVVYKMVGRNLAIPRDDTAIFVMVPKQGEAVSLLTLNASGSDDPQRLADLRKFLPKVEE